MIQIAFPLFYGRLSSGERGRRAGEPPRPRPAQLPGAPDDPLLPAPPPPRPPPGTQGGRARAGRDSLERGFTSRVKDPTKGVKRMNGRAYC